MTRDWATLPLGDVLTLQRGFDITRETQREGPYAVISSSGPKSTHTEFRARGPGVVIGRKGSLGTVFYSAADYWPHDTTLWVKDFHGNDPRFAYYFLRAMRFERLDAGASNPTLNRNHVHAIQVQWPPPPVQRRIASILSAYDDLIDNCEQRSRVLERLVRTIYREWFVNFRYPGHEKMALVDSPLGRIPKDWRTAELGELSLGPDGVQTGPFGSQLHQHEYSVQGVPVVMPKDLRGYRIDDSDIARVSEGIAERLGRHRMRPGDIVYGRRGDIGRRAFVMGDQSGALCGTGCLRIRPDSSVIDGWYLFQHLGREEVVALIAGRAQGVTMPNLNTKLLATVPVFVPPRPLQDKFRDLSFPMAVARANVISQVTNLRKTRDLLLPRLISGELSVEAAA